MTCISNQYSVTAYELVGRMARYKSMRALSQMHRQSHGAASIRSIALVLKLIHCLTAVKFVLDGIEDSV